MSQPLVDWGWVTGHVTDTLLPALGQHVLLSAAALLLGLMVAVPSGVAVARRPRAYAALLTAAGLLYTIPSLAFFILLISIPGIGLGARPALIALAAYTLLMLIRNVVEGLRGVPPAVRDAALGMGLTTRQLLLTVELPLALPVIVAGMRLAAVSTIGIATIAAYIGGGGLGTLIFEGIDQNFPTKIVIGGALTTLLSVVVDAGLTGLERVLQPWQSRLRAAND